MPWATNSYNDNASDVVDGGLMNCFNGESRGD